MKLFKKKNKRLNIINFDEGCYGKDILYDKNITKTICKMHGWYSNYAFSDNTLKVGSLVLKKGKSGYWYGRVKKIEWCPSPNDMFFAKIKTIYKDTLLSKEEMKYLKDNNLINLESEGDE